MGKKIVITGGTGLIGSRLTELLLERGDEVCLLSRGENKTDGKLKIYHWDIDKSFIDPEALTGADYIIHLAGAGIADKKWSPERKEVILKSRTDSAHLLYSALSEKQHQVKAFISASAIGYYGADAGDKILDEQSAPGEDFVAQVTKSWENSTEEIKGLGIRTVKLRIGVVLSGKGGALKALVQPIKLWVGAPLGSGDQLMSWIHIDDLCKMFIYAMENSNMNGAYNAVSPNPASNKKLTLEAAKILKKPVILPKVPEFALKILLGERAALVLGSAHVSSKKIEEAGFAFKYPRLQPALENLLH